jgi:hypothetical protein
MSMRIESTPAQRAAKYLKRIVALTEAKQDSPGKYRLKAGRRHILVDSGFVRVISHRSKSTCFSVAADMPSAEVIASALLQLKNNPRLLELWGEWRGLPFKANGHIFRGTSWGNSLETVQR